MYGKCKMQNHILSSVKTVQLSQTLCPLGVWVEHLEIYQDQHSSDELRTIWRWVWISFKDNFNFEPPLPLHCTQSNISFCVVLTLTQAVKSFLTQSQPSDQIYWSFSVRCLGVKSLVFSWSVKSSIMSNCQKCQTIHNVKLFVFLLSFPKIGKTPELRSDGFINLWKFDSIFLMCMLFPLTLNRVSISFLWHLNLLGNFSCVSCSQFQDWINLFPI